MKKLSLLKKARFEILNAEKVVPRKLKVKTAAKTVSVTIREDYMNSEFKNNVSEITQEEAAKEEAAKEEEVSEEEEKVEDYHPIDPAALKEHEQLKHQFLEKITESPGIKEQKAVTVREWRKIVGMYNTIVEFDPYSIVSRERILASFAEGLPDA
mmetsp:Transcript_24163/g.37128  ORF Transcript_24163/g.37128 Transcript_24163/m.37128 type:complete len:155 (+) Transcript_24163:720-1184(+)